MRGLRRDGKAGAWADVELESLKLELRDRALAVAEREADLDLWEQELERREARLDWQRESLQRRRLQVLKRLMRLRGRPIAAAAPKYTEDLYLDEELERRAAQASAAAKEAPKPAQRT